jgi:hypothetical protein
MSGQPELDLKNFWKLRLDLFKKVLHFIRVLDQGINWSREQVTRKGKFKSIRNMIYLFLRRIDS